MGMDTHTYDGYTLHGGHIDVYVKGVGMAGEVISYAWVQCVGMVRVHASIQQQYI